MDLQSILAALLNPNGSQQARPPQMGGAPPQVGDHANPALLMQGQPPQMPPQQAMPQQPPQGQPMPQGAPQEPQQPQGGGLGGILQSIIAPQSAQKNQTVGWLTSQGLDQGTATVLASDKGALRQYIMARSQGKKPIEIAGKLVDPNTYQVLADFNEKKDATPDSVRALDERAKRANLQPGTKAYNDFMTSGGSGPGINVDTGTVPVGYQAVRDDQGRVLRYDPIAGGPADTSRTDAAKSDNAATASDVITNAASTIRTLAKEPGATGIVGAGASYFPNSPAAELYRQVSVLKSNATIENLQAMRQASPTGGALGNVTEGEGQMLAAKSGALDPKSPNFEQQLDDYERTLLRTVHGRDAGDRIFEATRNVKPGLTPGTPATSTAAGKRVLENMTNPAPIVDWQDWFKKGK